MIQLVPNHKEEGMYSEKSWAWLLGSGSLCLIFSLKLVVVKSALDGRGVRLPLQVVGIGLDWLNAQNLFGDDS